MTTVTMHPPIDLNCPFRRRARVLIKTAQRKLSKGHIVGMKAVVEDEQTGITVLAWQHGNGSAVVGYRDGFRRRRRFESLSAAITELAEELRYAAWRKAEREKIEAQARAVEAKVRNAVRKMARLAKVRRTMRCMALTYVTYTESFHEHLYYQTLRSHGAFGAVHGVGL